MRTTVRTFSAGSLLAASVWLGLLAPPAPAVDPGEREPGESKLPAGEKAAVSPAAAGDADGAASDTAALIDQLGDTDPKVREAASRKLADLGKAALPELQKQRDTDDPEVRARVRSLIRKAERRLPPAAPPRHALWSRHSIRIATGNGERTVYVDDNGYRIKIRQGPKGIEMDVTGVEDGKEVTETYKAKDADELKRETPEAFALYDKYNNGGTGAFRVQMGGGNGQIRGQVIVGGEVPQELLQTQIRLLEAMIARLEAQGNVPPEHVAAIAEQVARLREQQAALLEKQDKEKKQEQNQDVQQKQLQEMKQRREAALDKLKVPLRDEPQPEPAKGETPDSDRPKQEKPAPEKPADEKPAE